MKVVAINGSPRKGGNVSQCLEVMAVIAKLARNIAWTVKVIDAAKGKIDPPETHARPFYNYIR